MKRKIALLIVGLFLASASGWMVARYYLSPERRIEIPLIELQDGQKTIPLKESPGKEGAGTSVKLFFPSGEGIVSEERRIAYDPLPAHAAEAIVGEYLKGLPEGLRDTKLLGIYRDKSNILYIDLSDEYRRNFSGGARQEYSLLKSLFETVMSNISGTEDVKVLIEGKETETIGGHFFILYPLKETIAQGTAPSD